MEAVGETAWMSFRGLSEILGHDIAVPFREKSEIAGIIDQVSRIASFFFETGTRCNVGQTVDGPAGTILRVAESPWGQLRPRVWALVPARSV